MSRCQHPLSELLICVLVLRVHGVHVAADRSKEFLVIDTLHAIRATRCVTVRDPHEDLRRLMTMSDIACLGGQYPSLPTGSWRQVSRPHNTPPYVGLPALEAQRSGLITAEAGGSSPPRPTGYLKLIDHQFK